ncbi:MAG: hypothetical protein Q8K75_10075 [Chlamydiales bacterium]|nr:hypothetical protein [Chlamydiales bacterium]
MEVNPYLYLKALSMGSSHNYTGPGEILPVRGGVLQVALVKGILWDYETNGESPLVSVATAVISAFAAALDAILHAVSVVTLALRMIPEAINWKVAGATPQAKLSDQLYTMMAHLANAVGSLAMVVLIPVPAGLNPEKALQFTDSIRVTGNISWCAKQMQVESPYKSPLSAKPLLTIASSICQIALCCTWRPAKWMVKTVANVAIDNPELSIIAAIATTHFSMEAYGATSPIRNLFDNAPQWIEKGQKQWNEYFNASQKTQVINNP